MLPTCNETNDPNAAALWKQARNDIDVAELLCGPFTHPAGRVLLLHHEELFPTIRPDVEGAPQRLTAEYLLWNSHTIKKHERTLSRVTLSAQRHRAYVDANGIMDKITGAIQNSTRDSVVLAALKVIQENEIILALLKDQRAISFEMMKPKLRDYRDIDFEKGAEELKLAFQNIIKSPESRSIINTAAINLHLFIDMMTHMTDAYALVLVGQFLEHQRKLLELVRLPEGQYRDLLLKLHHLGFVDHAGPAHALCPRPHCLDGTITTLRTTVLSRRIRCPICGHATAVITMLRPSGALDDALHLWDGFIAASIGWFLKERDIPFCHGYKLSDGKEIDFLVECPVGLELIECKTHKRDSGLAAILAKDLDQVIKHVGLLKASGINVAGAVGVSNLTAEELQRNAPQPSGVDSNARLLSYEGFPNWLKIKTRR